MKTENYGWRMTKAQASLVDGGHSERRRRRWEIFLVFLGALMVIAVFTLGFEMGLRADDGASLVRQFAH